MPRTEPNTYWGRENEELFIVLCHGEYLKGNLLTKSFSPPVWTRIIGLLNGGSRDGSRYNVKQCKSKWKRIKESWALLAELRYTGRGSGLEWSEERNTVIGPDEVLKPIYDVIEITYNILVYYVIMAVHTKC